MRKVICCNEPQKLWWFGVNISGLIIQGKEIDSAIELAEKHSRKFSCTQPTCPGVLTLVLNVPYQAFIIFYYLYSILGHIRLLQQVNLRFKTKILVYFTVTQYWKTLMPKITVLTKHPQRKRYNTLVRETLTFSVEIIRRGRNFCRALIYSA